MPRDLIVAEATGGAVSSLDSRHHGVKMAGEDDQIGIKLAAAALELEELRVRFSALGESAIEARFASAALALRTRAALFEIVGALKSGKAASALELAEQHVEDLDRAMLEMRWLDE